MNTNSANFIPTINFHLSLMALKYDICNTNLSLRRTGKDTTCGLTPIWQRPMPPGFDATPPRVKLLFVFGTRPEAIKMAPLIRSFAEEPAFDTRVCVTGQHRQQLDQVLDCFSIKPDYDLNLMLPDQTLFDITQGTLSGLREVMEDFQPHNVLVQGDTTTAMAASLAAFYLKKDVSHIEAGLRSHELTSPFPEEGNRRIISQLARFHFTHSSLATKELESENITENVYQVGNTGIDALTMALRITGSQQGLARPPGTRGINLDKRIILVTCHRRENLGTPFRAICAALREIAIQFPEVDIIYPVHPNPKIRSVANQALRGVPNIKLIEPLSYPELLLLMTKTYLILSDSGGIQEEAPFLGKPLLVMRNVTERWEGVQAGNAILVGTDTEKIVHEAELLLENKSHYDRMSRQASLYGDGNARKRVIQVLKTAYYGRVHLSAKYTTSN